MASSRKKAPAKAVRKSRGKSPRISSTAGKNGPVPPYGIPIRDALARGDLAEMRRVAASTRRWLKGVNTALARLEKAIASFDK